jgi:hypothetical protein
MMNHLLLTAIPTLNMDEAQAYLTSITAEADQIDNQLNAAKATWASSGKYADPNWYQKANAALKIRRRLITALQQHIKGLKKVENVTMRDKYADCFISAARSLLQPDTYEMLVDAARTMSGEEVYNECIPGVATDGH